MKICFITTFFTGATLPLAQHLQEKGYNCDFYIFARQAQEEMETLRYEAPVSGINITKLCKQNNIYNYLSKGIDISIVPYYLVKNRKYLIGYIPFFKNLRIIDKLLEVIETKKYDLIYIIVNEEHDAIVCRQLKNRGFKNVIIAYHEVVKTHTGEQELKDVVTATIRCGFPIICYSNHTRETLLKLSEGRIPVKQVKTVYFGPFETYYLFDTSVPMIKEKYILFIGSIQPYKGLSFLYQSITEYRKDLDFKVVVAGSGYDSCLENMNQDDRFIVINKFLSDEEFANLTKYASCIVCPYVSGSQSGITHTAMVFGTPVVATKVGAFPEFIEEGKNGCLVEYGDKKALVDAIIKATKCPRNYIPKQLEWDCIVKCLEDLCNKK